MKPWRLQKLVGDLVYDLRSRGLLPYVGLLIVAMVAVPVVITRSAEKAPPPDPAASEPVSAPENEAAVLAYDPGVRNYRKRLRTLQAKDPFKQHFEASTGAAAALGETIVADTGAASLGTSPQAEGGGSGNGSGSSGSTKKVVTTKYVSYQLRVSVGVAGALESVENVPTLDFLPSEKTPVVVYLGIGGGGKKALFLVSSDVSEVSGEGACLPSATSPCEILTLKQGEIENMTYGEGEEATVYRLKVTGIKRVVTTVNSG